MRQLLKSTTALVLASALAVPQPLWAQGEADPELERRDQLLQNQADQAHQQAQEAAAEEAKAKAQQRLEEGSDISEDEAKALAQAILYSEAQLKAKRHRG